jgi:proteasome lid subunit RPN8/RPN11
MSIPIEKPVPIRLRSEVIRAIRQHARNSMTEEICGVLIGSLSGGTATIQACIAGENAAQGGAHVTFTQDTWQHIYTIKDRDYPDDRILGWYHSHPGFGVFLSEHDMFIQQNFFSAKHQVAWVFDPHSDEEGCFGWNGDRIERLTNFAVLDDRGGEIAGTGSEEPGGGKKGADEGPRGIAAPRGARETETDSLEQFALKFLKLLAAAVVGFAVAWFVFPRIMVLPVPVDPQTGVPLRELRPPGQENNGTPLPPADGQSAGKGKDGNGHP